MTDLIIIGIVIVLMLVGVVSSKKHFKGEGGCCGGGSSVKPKKKKLKAVIVKKIFIIEGMTCDHCKNRVESVINEIDGVAAKVDIKKKEAVVSFEKEISEELIKSIIEKAGYEVTGIK